MIWWTLALQAGLAATAERAYPPTVYPPGGAPFRRVSEVPFAETDETRRYGFDRPWPDGPRRSFVLDDFGARADGTTDCTPAFYAALAAAQAAGGPAEVVFGPGRYLVLPAPALGSDELAVLCVRGARDLVVRGQGDATVLMIGDPALGGLAVRDSHTVMVSDLVIDYNPLPFCQGIVREVRADEGWFDLRLDDGYPTPAAILAGIPGRHAGYKIATAGDGAYRWPVIGGLAIDSVAPVDGAWRFHADPAALRGYLAPGDPFIFVGRRIAQVALGASDTPAFYVRRVAVLASPTCGLGILNGDGVSIDGYADTLPTGSTRLLSTNADGVYVQGCRGGFALRHSTFMGQGDDCLNLHCVALGGEHVRRQSATELLVATRLDARPGDLWMVMDPVTATERARLEIASAELVDERRQTLVRLTEPPAEGAYDPARDFLYPLAQAVPSFKVVHNYFGQNRSRCLLISGLGGLIEANTGENAEGYGVRFEYGGTAWREGVHARDVVIRRNLFRGVTNHGLAPVIEAGDGSTQRNYRNLTIADNTFINPRKMAVLIANCEGARIVGNTIRTEPGRRNTWNDPQWYPVDCSVYLAQVLGVTIDRHTVSDPNLTQSVIHLGPGAAEVTIGTVAANVPEGVRLVSGPP